MSSPTQTEAPLPSTGASASTALPLKAGRTHFPALDGLRGIAILLVLANHALQQYEITPYGARHALFHNVIASTGYGVVLFFVLSGFLITGILLDSKNSPNYFISFFGRRTVRIFPLYYGTLLAFWLLATFHGFAGDKLFFQRLPWLLAYIPNILMAWNRDWSFIFGRHSLGHFWSLAVEEQFYLFWPLAVFWCSTRTLRRICLAALPVALILRVVLIYGHPNWFAAMVLLPTRGDALALGAYVAILVRADEKSAARMSWIWVLIGASVWAASCLDGNLLITAGMSGFTVLSAGLLTVCLFHRIGVWFSNPVLRAFGKYSYGIYVFHVVLLPYIMFLKDPMGRFFFPIFFTLVSFIVAWLSWYLFEMHFLRLKRFFPADTSHAWKPTSAPTSI